MMYTITRGPSKLVTQRRTGPTQQVESKFSDLKLKPTSWLTSNSPPPKIVFNRLNGKRHNGTATQKSQSPAAEGFTPAHEENVRFVYEGKMRLWWLFVATNFRASLSLDLKEEEEEIRTSPLNQLSCSNVTGIWISDTTA
ncbi:MAPK regulated corepressor interacting protein 2 isoform X2 [Poecilia reticulata]|uniref:MAPK regulated corepressor interacting protein 2 isoform X2 n=1 Tax=Poecilia reticulata TaxID=8081 RepID=UPI0004A48D6E|nr:PREDICTED: protein FAM195A isoform X2 [Poecilia reticulata]